MKEAAAANMRTFELKKDRSQLNFHQMYILAWGGRENFGDRNLDKIKRKNMEPFLDNESKMRIIHNEMIATFHLGCLRPVSVIYR